MFLGRNNDRILVIRNGCNPQTDSRLLGTILISYPLDFGSHALPLRSVLSKQHPLGDGVFGALGLSKAVPNPLFSRRKNV